MKPSQTTRAVPTYAEWTAEELIEALLCCHRIDAPIWFKYGDHDLNLLSVSTEGGEVCIEFADPPPEDEHEVEG